MALANGTHVHCTIPADENVHQVHIEFWGVVMDTYPSPIQGDDDEIVLVGVPGGRGEPMDTIDEVPRSCVREETSDERADREEGEAIAYAEAGPQASEWLLDGLSDEERQQGIVPFHIALEEARADELRRNA